MLASVSAQHSHSVPSMAPEGRLCKPPDWDAASCAWGRCIGQCQPEDGMPGCGKDSGPSLTRAAAADGSSVGPGTFCTTWEQSGRGGRVPRLVASAQQAGFERRTENASANKGKSCTDQESK